MSTEEQRKLGAAAYLQKVDEFAKKEIERMRGVYKHTDGNEDFGFHPDYNYQIIISKIDDKCDYKVFKLGRSK